MVIQRRCARHNTITGNISSMMATRYPLMPTLLLLFLGITPPTTVDAFAAYLLSNVGCMTDLSTDEVIMNNQVVDAEDSDRPMVHLVLNNDDGQDKYIDKMETVQEITKIWLKELPLDDEEEEDHDLEFHIQLYVDNVQDLQFVMETTPGAVFVNGQCEDDKRVAGRGQDFVALRIPATTNSPVQVWAGWATGHERVRLTYPLEFIPHHQNVVVSDHFDARDRAQAAAAAQAQALAASAAAQVQAIAAAAAAIDPKTIPQLNKKPKQQRQQLEDNGSTTEKWEKKLQQYEKAEEAKVIEQVQRQEAEAEEQKLKHRSNDKSDHRKGGHKNNVNMQQKSERQKVRGEREEKRQPQQHRGGAAKQQPPRTSLFAENDKSSTGTVAEKDVPPNRDRVQHYADRIREKQRKVTDQLGAKRAIRTPSKDSSSTFNSKDEPEIRLDTTWFFYGLSVLLIGTFGSMKGCLYASRKGDGKKGRFEL